MRNFHLAVAAALLIGTTPASAAIVKFNLTGVVTSGFDNGYLFPGFEAPFGSESAGINFETGETFAYPTGRAFSLVITADDSRGELTDGAFFRNLSGENADSPAKAAFTLNGFTYEVGASTSTTAYGGVEKYNAASFDGFGAYMESFIGRPPMSGPFTMQTSLFQMGLSLPPSVFSSIDFGEQVQWVNDGSYEQYGRFRVSLQNTDGGPERYVIGAARIADLNLRFDTLTVVRQAAPNPGAVPEPSTWAMLILGFGLVGAAARRRLRSPAVAAV